MFTTRSALSGLALVLPAVALAVAGCGSSAKVTAGQGGSSTPTSPTTQTTVTDTISLPPSTTTAGGSPTATGPVACTTANLTASLGPGDGAAGSEVYPLHLTNKGAAACTVSGFPGVSFVAPGTGAQVGIAATRATGAAQATVTLSPGGEATSQLKVTDYLNYPAAACAATAVAGFRVYPPDNTAAAAVTLPAGSKACTKVSQLEVQPVVAGAGTS